MGGMIFPVVLLETAPQASGLRIWPPLPSVEEVRRSPCEGLQSQARLAANQVGARSQVKGVAIENTILANKVFCKGGRDVQLAVLHVCVFISVGGHFKLSISRPCDEQAK